MAFGVLSYAIENKNKSIPEFYLPEDPIIKYAETDFFAANGWVQGWDVVHGFIETFHTEDGNVPAFEADHNGVFSGIIECPVIFDSEGYIGEVSGAFTANSTNLFCECPVEGIVTNNIDSTVILIAGNVQIDFQKTFSKNFYNIKSIKGVVETVPSVSNDDSKHIKDITAFNILGRKYLSSINPILGVNLHMSSRNVDDDWKYAEEEWSLVQYENTTNFNPPEKLPGSTTLLNSPGFARQLKTLQEQTTAEQNTEQNVEQQITDSEFFVYKKENILTILVKDKGELVELTNLLYGPTYSLQDCRKFLENYSLINNIKLEKLNTFEYEIVELDF